MSFSLSMKLDCPKNIINFGRTVEVLYVKPRVVFNILYRPIDE